MSYLIEEENSCPYCLHPNTVEVWAAVNVKEDPELKDLLIGGEMNMSECAACHRIFYAENFVLYHDPDQELMGFVYPLSYRLEEQRWRQKTLDDFQKTQGLAEPKDRLPYLPVTFFGLDELVSLVEHETEMSIQSEILETLAQQHGLGVRRLRPFVARSQKLPVVLPVADGPTEPKRALMEGILSLRKLNDRLSVYNEVYDRLAGHPEEEVVLG